MLGDAIRHALPELRREAEERMRATCTIVRPGETETDADGNVTTPTTPVYAGKCYSRYPGLAFETNLNAQTVSVAQSKLVVRIPFGATIRPGDVVKFTADPHNPQLVGTRVVVTSIDDQSQATAQRLLCNDFQAPAGFADEEA